MRCLSKSIAFCIVWTSFTAYAGESINKISKTIPSSTRAVVPVAISSNSKMVKDFLKQYKSAQVNNKNSANNAVPKASSRVYASGRQNKSVTLKEKNKAQVVIHLDTPETLPPVVNKTGYFVFRDITRRGEIITGQSNDLAERMKKIESLRQAALR